MWEDIVTEDTEWMDQEASGTLGGVWWGRPGQHCTACKADWLSLIPLSPWHLG